MRIKIANDCNVCTDEHSKAYQTPARGPAPEITIPTLRARLSIREAESLARDLTRAVAVAKKEQAIARSKREILADITSGRVPATVTRFATLHDYVDANEYGGACEDTVLCADDDSNIAECQANTDFWNDVHLELDLWLQRGRE